MFSTHPRRRVWLIRMSVVALFLVAGTVAWQFRPLNATERRLAGAWRSEIRGRTYLMTFLKDRRFQFQMGGAPEMRGSWKASGSTLTYWFDVDDEPFIARLRRIADSIGDKWSPIKYWTLDFETDDFLRVTLRSSNEIGLLRREITRSRPK